MEGRVSYTDLKKIKFPDCHISCHQGNELGVCECESCCPHKFNEKGEALNTQELLERLKVQSSPSSKEGCPLGKESLVSLIKERKEKREKE